RLLYCPHPKYSVTVLRSMWLACACLQVQNYTAFRGIFMPNSHCFYGLVFGLSPVRFTYVFAVTLLERFGEALKFSRAVLLLRSLFDVVASCLSVVPIYVVEQIFIDASDDSHVDEHSFHTSSTDKSIVVY
uniref:Uncharacterized protein n=1 Tax=Parascaris univalens TaxID=6257 RepID=A0A915AGB4_PARUN